MKTRKFGRTELDVTEVAYGAMELRKVDDTQAGKLLNAVLDHGINLIDTSPDYGPSEDIIGKHLADRRDEYILASKCGCNVPPNPENDEKHIWTREQVLHNVDHSLQRLKTDRLDLLQIHSAPADDIEAGGLVEAMKEVQEQGKVRFIGYTATGRGEFGFTDIKRMLEWDVFDFYQLPYNVVARAHENTISAAAAKGAGIILRGTVKPIYARLYDMGEWDTLWEKANLDELLDEGEDRYRFMLRYAISHPDYSTDIIGTRSLDHLADNIATFEKGPLTADTLAEARKRLDAIGVTAREFQLSS